MSDHAKSDRRQFLKTVGLAGITTALAAPALTRAQTRVPAPAGPPVPVPADTTKAAATAVGEDAGALADIIRRRYGRHLSEAQLASIARDFDGDLKALERMRQVKLVNGDEPDFTFYVKGARR